MGGWHYNVGGRNFGPVTFDELVEFAKNRNISCDDEVRFGENGIWRKAGSIGRLLAHFPFNAVQKIIPETASRGADASVKYQEVMKNDQIISRKKSYIRARHDAITLADDDRYWCLIQGLEYGPVDRQKLNDWAANRRLNPGDQVRQGSAPYALAEELPGLFPRERQSSLTNTNAAMISVSETQEFRISGSASVGSPVVAKPSASASAAVPNDRLDSRLDSPIAELNRTPSPMPTLPIGYGTGGSRIGRPQISVRQMPRKKANSSHRAELLTGKPAMAGVGILLLGALMLIAGPFISFGESADVKRFHELRNAYHELAILRNEENVKADAFEPLNQKLEQVANKVADQVKGSKDPKQRKLFSLATKMRELSKEKLGLKPTEAEAIVGKTLNETAKRLGVKS